MAEQKCSKILAFAHIMMVLTVMFFVFSCVLSLTPADLAAAKAVSYTHLDVYKR